MLPYPQSPRDPGVSHENRTWTAQRLKRTQGFELEKWLPGVGVVTVSFLPCPSCRWFVTPRNLQSHRGDVMSGSESDGFSLKRLGIYTAKNTNISSAGMSFFGDLQTNHQPVGWKEESFQPWSPALILSLLLVTIILI